MIVFTKGGPLDSQQGDDDTGTYGSFRYSWVGRGVDRVTTVKTVIFLRDLRVLNHTNLGECG